MRVDGEAEKRLCEEVKADFFRRREERRALEQQWSLNLNYLIGNQYCEISPTGEIDEEDKNYYWQSRNVYNQIAPIFETRVAKLSRVRPAMSVRAAGADESDIKTAKLSTDVLNSTCQRVAFDDVISKATVWSETLGSSFYKVVWSPDAGRSLGSVNGEEIREGDVSIIPVSPFEIYPDSLFHEDIGSLKSLIHARAMHVDDVERLYGVRVNGEDVDVFKMDKAAKSAYGGYRSNKIASGVVHDNVIVIERYETPSKAFPRGRVVTVAGDRVLAVGDLPFMNGVDGKRALPFAKQDSLSQPGCFFGASVIERVIPIQRAYNAVKNRKHEFINRLSMGVVTVEDGSVDADELIEEGLSPGKVIVYRQGSVPPKFMTSPSVPLDFTYEEERLMNEFITISGVSEISRNSALPESNTSGVALQILLEQDETRLAETAESIKRAIKEVARQILRLFKQFAGETRMMRLAGSGGKSEVFYFNSSDLGGDDVVFDTENEISNTPAQKKNAVMELLGTGLLSGDDGRMDRRTKTKLLEIMGFGSLDNANDLTQLHAAKAAEENLALSESFVPAEEFDDHDVHIIEHTRFLLSGEANKDNGETKERILRHMRIHKQMKAADNRAIDGLNAENAPQETGGGE